MRAGKSYLAAYRPTWYADSPLPTCLRYSSEDETFEHVTQRCPTREWARHRFLREVPSLDPASPVWSSLPLIVALAKFIKATVTGFPDSMPPMGTDSPYTTPLESPVVGPPLPPHIPLPTHALTAAFAAAWGASV